MSLTKYLASKAGEAESRMKHSGARLARDCGDKGSVEEISGGPLGN